MTKNEKYARRFIKAIKKITSPDYEHSLESFENYLKEHFADWLEGYCDTPEHITNEIEWFINLDEM